MMMADPQGYANAVIANANVLVAKAQAATTTKVDGLIRVNDADFPAVRCVSGQVSSFNGVELYTADNRKMRFVSEVDGKTTVIYFSNAGGEGATLHGCGKLNVAPTNASLNGVRMMSGSAEIVCRNAGLHIEGQFSFQCSQ